MMNEMRAGDDDRVQGEVAELLRASRSTAFEPGFAWRVMHRLRAGDAADPAVLLAMAVQRWFVRLAPVAALATVVLAAFNLRTADPGQPPLEAALGLPAVTLDQAYSPLLGAPVSTMDQEGRG